MKIKLSLEVAYRLLAYAAATRMEYSGFGFCDRVGDSIFVYDFVLLDVGSEGYTEIDPAKILPLMEREDRGNMRVFIHRHPIEGWSSRDLQTILKEPLGSTPEQVGWSVSMVLTPSGWIGRIDNYVNGITRDLEVEPNVTELFGAVRELARRPFQPGLFDSAGVEQWMGRDEDSEPWDLEGEDALDDPALEALEELAEGYPDPTAVTLAEVLEDFGVDWEETKKKVRSR